MVEERSSTWVWRVLRAFCVLARSKRRAVRDVGRGSEGSVGAEPLPLVGVLIVSAGVGDVGSTAAVRAAEVVAVLSASFVSICVNLYSD